jgi:hypothetical protein
MKKLSIVLGFCLIAINLFSCSSSKQLVVNNQQPEPIEASLPQKEIPNKENHIGFASLVETPIEAPVSLGSEEPTPNLFKAVPDSILNLIPTYTEVNPETKQEEQKPVSDPFARNPNHYARLSLTFGLIGFFTAITFYGPLIFGTMAIIYARRSRQYNEPNQKKARAGKIWGIASFIAIPLSIIAVLVLEYIFFF